MSDNIYTPPNYPVIRFIVKQGMLIAVVLAVVIIAAGFYAVTLTGSWLCALAGVIVGLLVAGGIASYVEVLRILSDTLIPR